MSDLHAVLTDPALPFMRRALVAALLASVPLGLVGSLIVVRRLSYLAAAIAHACLGGIGAALYLRHAHGLDWLHPTLGALITAIPIALLTGWIHRRFREREDAIISAVWSIGMASGLLFLARTPAYVDPMSYLFGDILLLRPIDLWLIGGCATVVASCVIFFYKEFFALCFDEDYARLRGVPVVFLNNLLLSLTAVVVVLLVSVAGLLMVVALLALPAAAAGHFTRRLAPMMALAVGLAAVSSSAGIILSYPLDMPAGPVVILTVGAVFLGALLFRR
jgi:zinc transport system permease protein